MRSESTYNAVRSNRTMTANNDAAARRQHTVQYYVVARKTLRCMLPSRTKISRFYFATYHVRFFLFKQGTLEYESIHRGHSYCLAMRWRLMMMLLPPPRLPRMSQNRDWLMRWSVRSQCYVDPVRLSVARTCTDRCHRIACRRVLVPCAHACMPRHVPGPLSLVSTSSTPQVQPTMSATAEDLFGSSSDSEEELLGAAKEAATTKKTPPAASAAASGKLAVLGHLSCYE